LENRWFDLECLRHDRTKQRVGLWLQRCDQRRSKFIARSLAASETGAESTRGRGMAKLIIGVLLAVVLVLLYRGMRQEQATVDPGAPLDSNKILAVLQARHLPCDEVQSYTPIGKSKDGDLDGYLARCHDGGRYIYFQNPAKRYVGAASCQEEAFLYSYRCPD
jgi:hypothetical protein